LNGKNSRINLIDYNHIKVKRLFNQWTVIENEERRPDVVVFISNILVVVDLKSLGRDTEGIGRLS